MFAGHPGVVCASAGLSHDADTPVSVELVAWADLIFVMEQTHKAKLSACYKAHLAGCRVVCLGIPDKYHYMDPTLVKLLQAQDGKQRYEDVSALLQRREDAWAVVEIACAEVDNPDCIDAPEFLTRLQARFPGVPMEILE